MSNYATAKRAPRTLTEQEQAKLLRVSGEHVTGFRDHMIFSIALGTALREVEISALNCGDVYDSRGRARRRVALKTYKRAGKAGGADQVQQEVILPDQLRAKLDKFYRWKKANDQPTGEDDPLFASRKNARISTRRMRAAFAEWQEKCGFANPFTFHELRHTALTRIYEKTRDIRLVQRVARHANINTTTIYAAPSDEDVARAVRDLDC